MYLEKLAYTKVSIKELASIHLSKHYNESAKLTYHKLSQQPKSKNAFTFNYSYVDRELDDIVDIEYNFTDFNCTSPNTIKSHNAPLDCDWIKLVHKTLLDTNPELANKYMQEAIQKHKRFMTTHKNNKLLEIREARMKALEALDIEMKDHSKSHEELIALAQISKQENNHEM